MNSLPKQKMFLKKKLQILFFNGLEPMEPFGNPEQFKSRYRVATITVEYYHKKKCDKWRGFAINGTGSSPAAPTFLTRSKSKNLTLDICNLRTQLTYLGACDTY